MRKDIQRGLYGLALATGIFILGTSEATAAETTGENSIAGGTQATPELTTPVTINDNAITLIGDPATGSTDTGSGNTNGSTARDTTPVTSGQDSIAGGTQITPTITAPIAVDDNAVTVLGDPATGSTDGERTSGANPGTAAPPPVTNGENSLGGGTQVTPVITAPVGVQDNAITVIGDPATGSTDTADGNTEGTTGQAPVTDGQNSIGGGTQITPVITAPIAVEDNAITVIGDPATGSADGEGTPGINGGTTTPAPVTNGENSLGGGTQITPVITAPVGVQDNAITVIGDPATGSTDTDGTAGGNTEGTTGQAPVTDGQDSIAGGTQITPVITAPIAVEDNAITVIGDPATSSGSGTSSGSSAPGSADGGSAPVTTGEDSIGGGTQITPIITAPVGVQDNAITVIGDPATGSTDTDGTAGGNTEGTTGPAPVSNGQDSIGGGTQITPVITTPITVEDNAVTVIGDPTTNSGDTTTGGAGSTDTDGAGASPVTDGNGTDNPEGTDSGITTPVTDDNGLGADAGAGVGAGAGAEGTIDVGGTEGAAIGGTVTAGGTVDAHTADGPTLGAASQGRAVAGGSSLSTPVTVASASGASASSPGAGSGTEKTDHRSAGAAPDGVLAHTGATTSMIAGMGIALMVAGAVLLLASRRRALLR